MWTPISLFLALVPSAWAWPSVTVDQDQYIPGEDVVATWDDLDPATASDWIALADAGSRLEYYLDWSYTGGLVSGTHTFQQPAVGTYVTRVFAEDSLMAQNPAFAQVGDLSSLCLDRLDRPCHGPRDTAPPHG